MHWVEAFNRWSFGLYHNVDINFFPDMPLQSSGLLLAKHLWQKHETFLVTFVPVWITILGALQRLAKMDIYSWVLAKRRILSSFLKNTVCLLDWEKRIQKIIGDFDTLGSTSQSELNLLVLRNGRHLRFM